LGLGMAVPETTVTSTSIEERLGLDSGWIKRRTGIVARPVAMAHEATSDFAFAAAKEAISQAGGSKTEIRLLVLATSTPDHVLPPTSPSVAHRLGLRNTGAFDLAGACSGFLYGLVLADSFCRLHGGRALVIGANVLTKRLDWEDPGTSSLFSDGAGAVVWGPVNRNAGIKGVSLNSDGSEQGQVWVPEGGARSPFGPQSYDRRGHLMKLLSGPRLFRSAVNAMVHAGIDAMKNAECSPEFLDHWIPHQANDRLIKEAGRQLMIPEAITRNRVAVLGNSSAATIPIVWAQVAQENLILPGERVLLTSVGAGLISAGLVLTN